MKNIRNKSLGQTCNPNNLNQEETNIEEDGEVQGPNNTKHGRYWQWEDKLTLTDRRHIFTFYTPLDPRLLQTQNVLNY